MTILTDKQQSIIAFAACGVPSALLPAFHKCIDDVLRGKRQIWDTDVTHACGAALVKIAPPQRQMSGLTQTKGAAAAMKRGDPGHQMASCSGRSNPVDVQYVN
jgi:hypothetical protein